MLKHLVPQILAMMVARVFAQDFMVFHTISSRDNPGNFSDGMYVYLPAKDNTFSGTFSGSYLLCSSCTISYTFGTAPAGATPVESDVDIIFRKNQMTPIPVSFYEVELSIQSFSDASSEATSQTIKVTHQIALIDPKYQNSQYFDQLEPVLSLTPYKSTNADDQKRSFLYAVTLGQSANYDVSYALMHKDQEQQG